MGKFTCIICQRKIFNLSLVEKTICNACQREYTTKSNSLGICFPGDWTEELKEKYILYWSEQPLNQTIFTPEGWKKHYTVPTTNVPAQCPSCGCSKLYIKDAAWSCSKCAANHLTKPADPSSEMVGGLKCSKVPPFHLIPRVAYERLAKRVALGEETKGKDAWNALSKNQEVLLDKEALARRLGHGIDHATKLLHKIASGEDLMKDDDDAAALMWAGMYAICSTDAISKGGFKLPPEAYEAYKKWEAAGSPPVFISTPHKITTPPQKISREMKMLMPDGSRESWTATFHSQEAVDQFQNYLAEEPTLPIDKIRAFIERTESIMDFDVDSVNPLYFKDALELLKEIECQHTSSPSKQDSPKPSKDSKESQQSN